MNNKQLGMTLVELMVTLAVVAILAATAVPSLSRMIEDNKLLALNNQVVSAINYARSEAVKLRYNVVICVRNTSGSGCNNLGGFDQGWIIFADCNANGTLDTVGNVCDSDGNGTLDSPEAIFQDSNGVVNSGSGNISIVSNSTGNQRRIIYSPNGRVDVSATLTVQSGPTSSPVPRYNIILAPFTGRVTSCKVPEGGTTC